MYFPIDIYTLLQFYLVSIENNPIWKMSIPFKLPVCILFPYVNIIEFH